MDCLDCHTRPSHQFKTAARALDQALAVGEVNSDLPWIRKYGVAALLNNYASPAEASERIPELLEESYLTNHPDLLEGFREPIARAAAAVAGIHNRNVYPFMGIEWGTYPDHSGHTDFPGCFRCHGSELRDATGKGINADCSLCHVILAIRQPKPEILRQLGIGT